MRSTAPFALLALFVIALPASAARGVASATIIVPALVALPLSSATPSVSITHVRDGTYEHVTVAFN